MLFNSYEFAIFFVVVTTAYWLLPHRYRWSMLLLASCIFYMMFVPVYILILLATIVIDYVAGIYIYKSPPKTARLYLIGSIISTCLVLFVFKYFNFFAENVEALARLLHWNYSVTALQIILPIGLSFHTFQSLSYVIEVYRKKQEPERHFGIYSLYVMFYPQLVAGPIERPQNLLHQFREEHVFNYAEVRSGLLLMAWGFFKKLVIADRLALYSNYVFANPRDFKGLTLFIGLIFFAYQIYCDFSGYSDIARGSARMMGFRLMRNFNRPYLSRSIGEFWSRWHISLSTWFRDYVYFPLGGSFTSTWKHYRNLLIVFGISGLWHGANWTFMIWGLLNGAYLIVEQRTRSFWETVYRMLGCSGKEPVWTVFQIGITFFMTLIAWTFFRANSLSDALYILSNMWNFNLRQSVSDADFRREDWVIAACAIVILEMVEYAQSHHRLSERIFAMPFYSRWVLYTMCVGGLLFFGVFEQSVFIYFQF